MNTIARNNETTTRIRLANPKDAAAIRAIYEPYVLTTAITFDLVPPTVEELTEKIAATLAERPFLVAEEMRMKPVSRAGGSAAECDCRIVGFSYASPFRPRGAYIHAIETSVYLRQDYKGKGLGRRLYTALENILRLQHVYTANACISYIDPPDEYSPATSRLFHERMGYVQCAHIPNCGRKFDRWYGIIWMQKEISPIPEMPEAFIPLPSVDETELKAALERA